MNEQQSIQTVTTADTGKPFAAGTWLDTLFETASQEFESLLNDVPFDAGDRVLDAGCGPGNYLPLIARRIGAKGHIDAIDLSPESIALARQRCTAAGFPCSVDLRVGSVLELPYPNGTFDRTWSSLLLMYLNDSELEQTIREMKRVTKSGGIVAAADWDGSLARTCPADPLFHWHFMERARSSSVEMKGILRSRELRRLFEQAGFLNVRQRTVLIERWAPLTPAEKKCFGQLLSSVAALAEEIGLDGPAGEYFRNQKDPDSPNAIVNHPEFHACRAVTLVIGQVP